MDVSEEILKNHITYGASDYTASHSLSSSKALNYVKGGSITKPELTTVQFIPYTLNYQDSVGLFGAENHFVKINVRLDPSVAGACYEEPFWECAKIRYGDTTVSNTYAKAVIDFTKDLTTVNTYDPAKLNMSLTERFDAFISIDLNNLKTGNTYIDSWFDTRLYTSDREEHPYDKMYVRTNDFFYIGFHARNTRRLPYNVNCVVGNEYLSYEQLPEEERRYIAKVRQ